MHPLKVSLEELYNGCTKKLSLAKNVICSKCDGCAAPRLRLDGAAAEAAPRRLPQEGQQVRQHGALRGLPGGWGQNPPAPDCARHGAADAGGVPGLQRRRRDPTRAAPLARSGARQRAPPCTLLTSRLPAPARRRPSHQREGPLPAVPRQQDGAGQEDPGGERRARHAAQPEDRVPRRGGRSGAWTPGARAHATAHSRSRPSFAQPDTIPGDIIFIIQQKEHAIFKRKGACAPRSAAFRACMRLAVSLTALRRVGPVL